MPLSEHEQRMLEQIEQALYREDPRFGRLVRSSDPRIRYRRRLVQGLLGLLIGAGLIAAGILTHRVYLEAAGGLIMVVSALWTGLSWRRRQLRTAAARGRKRRRTDQNRPRASRARFMERVEERWRRRQEGYDRY